MQNDLPEKDAVAYMTANNEKPNARAMLRSALVLVKKHEPGTAAPRTQVSQVNGIRFSFEHNQILEAKFSRGSTFMTPMAFYKAQTTGLKQIIAGVSHDYLAWRALTYIEGHRKATCKWNTVVYLGWDVLGILLLIVKMVHKTLWPYGLKHTAAVSNPTGIVKAKRHIDNWAAVASMIVSWICVLAKGLTVLQCFVVSVARSFSYIFGVTATCYHSCTKIIF